MKYVVLLVSTVLLSPLSYAAIYQCTDVETGKITFKDKPCQSSEVLDKKIEDESNINLNTVESHTNNKSEYTSPLGKNLLINSSFENQLIDWRVPLGGSWSHNQGVATSGALIIQADIPPQDKYIHETTISQCVLLPKGEKFQLKGDFKAEKVLSGEYAEKAKFANRVNVIWYESTDCTIGGQFGWYIEPKNIYGWQSLKKGELKPAFKAKAALINIVQKGRFSRGHKGYWDNISFSVSEIFEQSKKTVNVPNPKYTLALNKNYIKNGTFTKDLAGWHAWKAKWSIVGNRTVGSANVTFADKNSGFGAGAMDQCVNIGKNTSFDFGASVKKNTSSTQTGSGRIRVSWNAKENCKGRSKTDSNSADFKDADGWQHLQVNHLVAPKGTQSVHIELIQSIAGSGRFSVYWDDVYFKAVKSQQ